MRKMTQMSIVLLTQLTFVSCKDDIKDIIAEKPEPTPPPVCTSFVPKIPNPTYYSAPVSGYSCQELENRKIDYQNDCVYATSQSNEPEAVSCGDGTYRVNKPTCVFSNRENYFNNTNQVAILDQMIIRIFDSQISIFSQEDGELLDSLMTSLEAPFVAVYNGLIYVTGEYHYDANRYSKLEIYKWNGQSLELLSETKIKGSSESISFQNDEIILTSLYHVRIYKDNPHISYIPELTPLPLNEDECQKIKYFHDSSESKITLIYRLPLNNLSEESTISELFQGHFKYSVAQNKELLCQLNYSGHTLLFDSKSGQYSLFNMYLRNLFANDQIIGHFYNQNYSRNNLARLDSTLKIVENYPFPSSIYTGPSLFNFNENGNKAEFLFSYNVSDENSSHIKFIDLSKNKFELSAEYQNLGIISHILPSENGTYITASNQNDYVKLNLIKPIGNQQVNQLSQLELDQQHYSSLWHFDSSSSSNNDTFFSSDYDSTLIVKKQGNNLVLKKEIYQMIGPDRSSLINDKLYLFDASNLDIIDIQ
jgi:hypothetical protein